MHRVGFIVPHGFQMMSVAALTAFEIANRPPTGPVYDVQLLSKHGGPVSSSSGMLLQTTAFGDPAFDTVIVGSVSGADVPPSDVDVVAFVKQAAKASRRVASICSGAFVLAEAGLLNGRRATMHWAHAPSFRLRFPDVRTEEDRIHINDGPIWTSAGMTAGIDLVLALISLDIGAEAAKSIARVLVMHQQRIGGQRQQSAMLEMPPKSDRIEVVLAYIRQNLRGTLSIPELAAVANLSPRQFTRTFLAETGHSPAKAVELVRLEAARFMIESGCHSIKVVVEETGFADRERMRRAFLRTFGFPPQAVRINAKRTTTAGAD